MTARERRIGSLVCGAGGAVLIASLFLPWATAGQGEASGREFLLATDVLFGITGIAAITTALTGGGIGLFRPDLSLRGAADLLGLTSTAVIAWLIFIGFPEGIDPGSGAYIGLASSLVIAFGAADYGIFRGQPAFPRIDDDRAQR